MCTGALIVAGAPTLTAAWVGLMVATMASSVLYLLDEGLTQESFERPDPVDLDPKRVARLDGPDELF